jgi:hypothetical protein
VVAGFELAAVVNQTYPMRRMACSSLEVFVSLPSLAMQPMSWLQSWCVRRMSTSGLEAVTCGLWSDGDEGARSRQLHWIPVCHGKLIFLCAKLDIYSFQAGTADKSRLGRNIGKEASPELLMVIALASTVPKCPKY